MSANNHDIAAEGNNSHSNPFSRPVTPKTSPIQMGFIGLGNIGYMLAQNMALKGPIGQTGFPPILVWNRTVSKAEKLLGMVGADKARIAQDPEQVAQECNVIVVNLANDDIVRAIYLRIQASLKVPITVITVDCLLVSINGSL